MNARQVYQALRPLIDEVALRVAKLANVIAALTNRAFLLALQAPDAVVAPTDAILVAIVLPSVASGIFEYAFSLSFTDSAADTVQVQVLTNTGFTSVTGGTEEPNGVLVAVGSPIVVTGGTSGVVNAWDETFSAGNLQKSLTLAGLATGPFETPGLPTAIFLRVTSSGGHNLSGMQVSASANELP